MATQDKNKGVGNDGSWFLEAVGVVPPAPTPSEAVAALELDNTRPDIATVPVSPSPEIVVSSFDGSTGTSTSTFEPARGVPPSMFESTGELEMRPPPATSPVADDTSLSPVLRTRRSFRWPAVAFGVFLVAVAVLAFLWLPVALRQEVTGTRQTYADSAVALRQHLPTTQTALDAITNPGTPPEELPSAVPIISQLNSLADALAVAVSAPLPRTVPLFPNEEVTALEPLQDAALIYAAQASDLARQLGYSYVYRTTIPRLVVTGELPTTADAQTINALSVSLASSLVDNSTALSDLPFTDATTDLNTAAHAAVERYASWQDEYLTALSEGDQPSATELVGELGELRAGLLAELDATMGTARTEIDQQIVELATNLDVFMADLTRP